MLLVPAMSAEQKTMTPKLNSFLNGIREFNVFIIPDYPESLSNNRFKVMLNEIGATISARLEKSGFKVIEAGQIAIPFASQAIPQYKVSIGMYRLATGDYMFRVQSSVAVTIILYGQTREDTQYDVWMAAGTVETGPEENANQFVVDMVISQVESFITVYNKVNKKVAHEEEPKPKKETSSAAASSSVKAASSEPNAAPTNTQYEYSASKNSTIFHKADCPITKRILEQNLVKYATREDAMKDGKKPCRQCKP